MEIVIGFLIVYLIALYINSTHAKKREKCKIHSWLFENGLLKCKDCGYVPSEDLQ